MSIYKSGLLLSQAAVLDYLQSVYNEYRVLQQQLSNFLVVHVYSFFLFPRCCCEHYNTPSDFSPERFVSFRQCIPTGQRERERDKTLRAMETMLQTKFQNVSLDGNKKSTSFVKDAPNIPRYSLADTVRDIQTEMDFHIQVIKKSDKFKVLKFLRRFFFRDEPINQSIQLIPEGEDSTCQELEEYCTTDCLENNLSLMAVSTCGNIVGVSLNGKMEPHKSDEPEYITNCNNPKFKKILQLLHYVDSQVNAEGKLAGKNVLEVRIISVDSNWRGKGIAKKLMEKALEMAKEQDFDYVRTDCTSHFSAKLCERCGLRKYWEIKYIDYVDKNGKPIFTPAPPHTTVVSYTKPL